MRKKLIYTGYTIGLAVLFLLVTLKFIEERSWNAWSLPLNGKIIVLDAGHGGMDGGANFGSVQEKEISLKVTHKIKDYLQEQGALVILTREDDRDLGGTGSIRERKRKDLHERVKIINESDADLFLSIHLNAFPSKSSKGAQTFYTERYEENKQAALFIQAEIKRNLENTTREAKIIRQIYLMSNAKKPGALVEIGFLSNVSERQNLMDDAYQEKMAASVYKGILRYFTEKDLKKKEE